MKFECPECHAKYQIADEKIRGRTLKMDCRRCQYRITIEGTDLHGASLQGGGSEEPEVAAPPARRAGERTPPPAGARRGGSHVGPLPRRNRVSAVSPPLKPEPPANVRWHVAINDVPVGPIGREELSKKIASGAVNSGSLCWREGFADWKPLGEVEELADLLQPKAQPAPSKPALPAAKRPIPQRTFPSPAQPARASQPGPAPRTSQPGPAPRTSQPGPAPRASQPGRPMSTPTPVGKPARAMPSPRAPFGAPASASASSPASSPASARASSPGAPAAESRPSSAGAKVVPIGGRGMSAAPAFSPPEPSPAEELEAPTARASAPPASAPRAVEAAPEAAAPAFASEEALAQTLEAEEQAAGAEQARHSDLGLDFAEPVEAEAFSEPADAKKKRAKKKSGRKAKKDAVEDFFGGDAVDLRDSMPGGRASQEPAAGGSTRSGEGLAVAGFTPAPGATAPAATAASASAAAAPKAEPSEKKGGLPLGAWIAIVGAGAFGIALAVLVAPALVSNSNNTVAANTQGVAPPIQETVTEPQTQPTAQEIQEEPPQGGDEAAVQAPEGEGEGASGEGEPPPVTTVGGSGTGTSHSSGTHRASSGGSTSTSSGGSTSTGGTGGSTSRQSTTPDPRFDRFEDDSADEAPINSVAQSSSRTSTGGSSGSSAPAAPSLTAGQISTVVQRERQGLQRCYETAMRQTGQARTIRMDIDLTIGSGGGVVSVLARGQSLGGMNTCIERAVRRWRFPPSGDQTRTSFPIVFAGQD